MRILPIHRFHDNTKNENKLKIIASNVMKKIYAGMRTSFFNHTWKNDLQRTS